MNTGYPQPAPLDDERLENSRLAALRIINDELPAKAVLLHEGDEIDATTVKVETPPPTLSQPAEPKKRGRPRKKEGDPKGPYTKRVKVEKSTNSESAAAKPPTPPNTSSPAPAASP